MGLGDSTGLTRKQLALLRRLPDFFTSSSGLLLAGGEKRTAQSLVDRRLAIGVGLDHYFRTQIGRAHVTPDKEV